jgi:hypothetical protein
MTSFDSDDEATTPTLTKDERELIEEVASWDEEKYPLAKYAQRILRQVDEP